MNWEKTYAEKRVTVEEAAAVIRSGDTVYSSTAGSMPIDLLVAIGNRYQELENVTIWSATALYPYNFIGPETQGHIKYHATFVSVIERAGYKYIDCTSHHFSRADWFARNRILPDVYVAEVSAPDENGNMSLGPTGTYQGKTVAEIAKTVIVQVNPNVPFVYGTERAFLHVDEVDYICESNRGIYTQISAEPTELDEKIAGHIVPLICDGDCIQIGVGGVSNSVALELVNHKDLGCHTEMLGDALVVLAQKGIINGKKKNLHPGKIIAAFGLGTQFLYDFMHKNETLEMHPQCYVNDPYTVGRNDNMVSINSCLACDLTGQVASEALGFSQYSCTGGQLDFVRGASLSKNGRSFLCMNSTATLKDGTIVSRITPGLPYGTAVTTPRTDVHYVVTEYGLADLKDRSIKQRVEALIHIAHPRFRDELLQQAKEYKIIF